MATKKIFILTNGQTIIGEVFETNDNSATNIRYAQNIKKLGSELGDLAANGPTPETVLEMYGAITIPNNSIIFALDTDETLWPGTGAGDGEDEDTDGEEGNGGNP